MCKFLGLAKCAITVSIGDEEIEIKKAFIFSQNNIFVSIAVEIG
jgi:hypothetical protein